MTEQESEPKPNMSELLSTLALSLGFDESDQMLKLRQTAAPGEDGESLRDLRINYKNAAYEKIDSLPPAEQTKAQIALDIMAAAICHTQGVMDLYEEHLRDARDNAEYNGFQEIFQQLNSLPSE